MPCCSIWRRITSSKRPYRLTVWWTLEMGTLLAPVREKRLKTPSIVCKPEVFRQLSLSLFLKALSLWDPPVHVAYSTEKSDPLMSRMKMAVWEKRNKCYSLKCFDSIPLQIAIGYGFEKRTCFFKRWCSFTCKRKWFSSLKLIWKVQLSLGIPANLPEDPKFRVTMLTGVDGSLK